MNICVYGASSDNIDREYIAAGEALGAAMAQRGHGLIFGGGAHGMMGAAARGAHENGGRIVGVAPGFFHVDGVLFPHCTQLLETDTMRTRKQTMEDMSDGYIMVPGGVGTFDEFFEMLTLRQLAVHSKPMAILNTLGYFDGLMAMLKTAAQQGFMKDSVFTLFGVFEDPQELLDYMESYKAPQEDINTYKNIK